MGALISRGIAQFTSDEVAKLRAACSAGEIVTVLEDEASGDLEFHFGGAPLAGYDDLSFPATGINPAGPVDAPAVDTNPDAFPGTLLFSGSADNILALSTQMPHAWERGSATYPHIHWQNVVGTANATVWELYVRQYGGLGQAAGAWSAAIVGTLVTGSAPGTSEAECITTFGAVDMTGRLESALTHFKLVRKGSTDASASQARLIQIDFHYKKNKLGTTLEYPVSGT